MNFDKLINAIDKYIEKADENLKDQLEQDGFIEPEETVEYINYLEEATAAILFSETDFFMRRFRASNSVNNFLENELEKVIAEDVTDKAISNLYISEYGKSCRNLANKYTQKIDTDISVCNLTLKTQKHNVKWAKQLGSMMKETNYKAIRGILKQGAKKGLSIQEISKLIQDSGIRNEFWRAKRVALTETLRMHNIASYESCLQSPSVREKTWNHSGAGADSRDNHVGLSGKKVEVDKPFTLYGKDGGVYSPMFPMDPSLPASESINCHCFLGKVIDYDLAALPPEEKQYMQWVEKGEYDKINDDLDIRKSYLKITMKEPYITKDLQDIIKNTDGELVGLENRLKTRKSVMDKIDRNVQKAFNRGGYTTRKVEFNKLNDIIRYTTVSDEKNFVQNFNKTRALLEEKGYNINRITNTWRDGQSYKGINCTLKNTDTVFELQFHTPKSYKVKQQTHSDYEILREKQGTREELKKIREKMVEKTNKIPNPKGVENIK